MHFDIVVPILNEAALVQRLTDDLVTLDRAANRSVIVVDGGSNDNTDRQLRDAGLNVVGAPTGRASQMNHGARALHGDVIVFLHADTQLTPDAIRALEQAAEHGSHWGRFDVRILGQSRWLKMVEFMMNLRSRLSSIATGDQAIFVRRELFERIGGFREQPLMEDIELSIALRKLASPTCLRARVLTSGRRWDEHGAWSTICLMWKLRFAYWRGVSAEVLAAQYA